MLHDTTSIDWAYSLVCISAVDAVTCLSVRLSVTILYIAETHCVKTARQILSRHDSHNILAFCVIGHRHYEISPHSHLTDVGEGLPLNSYR